MDAFDNRAHVAGGDVRLSFEKRPGGNHFELRKGDVVLGRVDQNGEAGFLGEAEKLRGQNRRIDAALAQGREPGAGAAGLEKRHVFIGNEAVTLQN